MGLLMLAAIGMFPLSVLLAGAVVHTAGPASFFPAAGTLLAAAVAVAASQPAWRSFGASELPDRPSVTCSPGEQRRTSIPARHQEPTP